MSKFTLVIRKYIGSIAATIGIILLTILTYGDMGEIFTEQYWQNVGGNISSISALSLGLVMIQVFIKQGLCEQALSNGINTKTTTEKFNEHKSYLNRNRTRSIYLPYFLSMRNKRETQIRKQEFLSENDFKSESALYASGNKKLIKRYKAIKVNITVSSLKWSTTDISYNKYGRIEKLDEYRRKRAINAVIQGVLVMFATTLITGGLFLDTADIPFWQKTVKLVTYLIAIAITVIPSISKNYEKGAFSVPNELDEVNNIWKEFEMWVVPEEIKKEVEKDYLLTSSEKIEDEQGVCDVQRENTTDTRAAVQEESEKIEII